MKEQRFEKIVEWDEEPYWFGIMVGLFAVLASIGIEIFQWNEINKFGVIFITLFQIYLIIISRYALGSDRKVYWRKVR